MADIRVVLRAPSSVRFPPEQRVEVGSMSPFGPVKVQLQTIWEDISKEAPIPRDLWAEVRGEAPSLDAALQTFPRAARMFGPMMAVAGNAEVGMVDVHLAYDATPGTRERDYVQVYQSLEQGLPTQGRHLDPRLFIAFLEGFDKVPDVERMLRVIGQYDLALSHWYFGGENLAVGHLFMAAEALSRVIIKRKVKDTGAGERELARQLEIDVEEHGWKSRLAAEIRSSPGTSRRTKPPRRRAMDSSMGSWISLRCMSERSLRPRRPSATSANPSLIRFLSNRLRVRSC
jgi:hypothetical protein